MSALVELLVTVLFLVLGAGAVVGLVFPVVWVFLPPPVRERVSAALGGASRSLAGRLVLLVLTGLLVTVPLLMVGGLNTSREFRLATVRDELAQQWGALEQGVTGPVLYVPIEERWTVSHSEWYAGQERVTTSEHSARQELLLFPSTLTATGDVAPQLLHRGLYEIPTFTAEVVLEATFEAPELKVAEGHTRTPLWDEARLVVGVNDLSGVSGVHEFLWNGESKKVESGGIAQVAQSEIHGVVGSFEGSEGVARVALGLRGVDSLQVAAAADLTEVRLAGDWASPSFQGYTLPTERDVGERFSARWSIPGVSRPAPRQLELQNSYRGALVDTLGGFWVGVTLESPASAYVGVQRAMSYAFLLIGLTLLTLLVAERALGVVLHPIQWAVNGLALATFYLVLLAGSEHLGFEVAYASAAGLVVVLVGGYTALALRRLAAGLVVGGALAGLYALTWAMLRSEDHSLLMGTTLVVFALVGLMGATRRMGGE